MKIMRLRHAKLIVVIIVVANLILFYYSWKSTLWKNLSYSLLLKGIDSSDSQLVGGIGALHKFNQQKSTKDRIKNANRHIRKSITIVFRSFYNYETDLKDSIDSLLDVVPNMPILIIQDGSPYPPFIYERNNTISGIGTENTVRFINLGFDIEKSHKQLNPLASINTKYVLFMPDSFRLSSKNILQKILREVNGGSVAGVKKSNISGKVTTPDEIVRRMIIVPFAGNMKSLNSCTQINLDLPNWTIQYVAVNISERCDLFLQKHAILIDVGVLKEMPEPFSMPFPEMFFIQAKILKIQLTIFVQPFQEGRRLFVSYHTKQRRMETRRRQFKEMYKKLQIKRIYKRSHKVIIKTDSKNTDKNGFNNFIQQEHNLALETQLSSSNFSLPIVNEIDLIGCERTTKSCIGSVYNNHPFYLYLGKHTPPCCMDKLKTTFNHVLEEFENVGIRYWLDNVALKTAVETSTLSPDAYEIDISLNVNDLERSNAMKKSQSKPYIDNEGFYWIKATDGYYFRVQFSKINQIGVNLFPYEIKGNDVHPSGFFGWKAKEFSADFLHPMSTVLFLGKSIMCPNNVREYLDFKKTE